MKLALSAAVLAASVLAVEASGQGAPPDGNLPFAGVDLPLPSNDGIAPPTWRGIADEDATPDLSESMAPKLSDKAPKPPADLKNLEGVWYHRDQPLQDRLMRTYIGTRLPYTEQSKAILKRRRELQNAGSPVAGPPTKCYPGMFVDLEVANPFQIVQRGDFVYFVFEEWHDLWQIRMNQQHDPARPPAFNGDSVGHWDGNTLVMSTRGFRAAQWLDHAGTPISKDAQVTHRIRRIENGQALEMIITIEDPQMYRKPWSYVRTFGWTPDKALLGEYDCEQQIGGKAGAGIYGVVEE